MKLSPDHNLAASISTYLNRFQREWGIRTQLQVDKTVQELPLYRITPAMEIQLMRILHERAASVGATVAILSEEGAGTTLVIELPLQPSQTAQTGEL